MIQHAENRVAVALSQCKGQGLFTLSNYARLVTYFFKTI